MISTFALANAINESAGIGYSNIEPISFAGSMEDANHSAQHIFMHESVQIAEFFTTTDELMAECAVSAPDRLEVLQENIFTSAFEHVKAFFEKIIAAIKGLIDKLKAYIYAQGGKTDKWLAIMRPKVEKVKNNLGRGDVKAEMHDWNEDYILKAMPAAIETLAGSWGADTSEAANAYAAVTKQFNDTAGSSSMWPEDKKNKTIETYNRDANGNEDKKENFTNNFPDKVGTVFGVTSGVDMESVWNAVDEKAYGGSTGKILKEYGSRVNTMLDIIKDYKTGVGKIKDAYNKHVQALTKYKSNLEKNNKLTTKISEDIPSDVVSAAKEDLNKIFSYVTTVTGAYETALGNGKTHCISLMQSMVKEYMGVLAKFTGYKEKKEG